MNISAKRLIGIVYVSAGIVCGWSVPASAQQLNLVQTPLFMEQSVSPLTMLVMGRNHKLYYEAYNDASDLNGDGVLDIKYKPNEIDYFGYFDSYKCYNYSNGQFKPKTVTNNKKCSGKWSGDFLNYLTTSRIDALRKVLYGGMRSTDKKGSTILERSHIPQDAHSWGKSYTSVAVDGYNITEYTPLSSPSSGKKHLFANTTLLNSTNAEPLLRVAANVPYKTWEWLSIERPVAGSETATGNNNRYNIASSITDYIVRVKVCNHDVGLEANCQIYPSGKYKPVGLLQEFGEKNQMKFGLLTGSYSKNLSGGVLRKNIADINDEINPNTGKFTSTVGIIKTVDKLKTIGFGDDYYYYQSCGWIVNRLLNNGECRMWGNPIAEMMYESLRYFAGKSGPTSAYDYSGGDDAALGLPKPDWIDPYDPQQNAYCAKPNMLVISDINPTYDSDELPGTSFGSFSGDLSGLNVSALGQTIWNQEIGGSRKIFIGEAGTVKDGAPTPKIATSFSNLRGIAPEVPNSIGSYYAGSVAYFGKTNDISSAQEDQFVNTYAVVLASPLPQIKVPVNGKTITLVPFAKSVGGSGIDPAQGAFQPTNTIVDFYVESLTATSGTFRINFEDVQQGADHDMDAVATYQYTVNADNTVTITVTSDYAAGDIIQHMGYIISGSTNDGVYLVVRDSDTAANNDVDYFLDVPNNNNALPLSSTITFTPSTASSATLLKDPLWYAAKWGSFVDGNENNLPDSTDEFDENNDSVPDNYFLVTNALNLKTQLAKALNKILQRSGSASSAAFNATSLHSGTILYQSVFNSADWHGQLLAYKLDAATGDVKVDGGSFNGSVWDAGYQLNNQNFSTSRKIITYKPSTKQGIAFRWPTNPDNPSNTELDVAQSGSLSLNPESGVVDELGGQRLNFLRGERANEQQNGGTFRDRSRVLGDIIHSSPQFVGAPSFPYPDPWPGIAAESSSPYSSFRTNNSQRNGVVYVGGNDGMLHGFDAETGKELLAYVPSMLYKKLSKLTAPSYTHNYYVDASPNIVDAFFGVNWHTVLVSGLNGGGQGIFALDVTDPTAFGESNASSIVLWEFSDADDADLGYTYSQPLIGRMANNKWVAIFGNGYNNTENDGNSSTTGNAVLYVVDLQTGQLIKKFDTLIGAADDPLGLGRANGLATAAAVDDNKDFIIEYVYVGDLFGNVWKLNLSDADPANWDFAFKDANSEPAPLFIAKDAAGNIQPITSRIEVSRAKPVINGMQLVFGTGKYLETSDKTDTSIQTFYSIIDSHTTAISGRNELLQQTILDEPTFSQPSGATQTVRVTSDNTLNNQQRGWYIDLVYNGNQFGERVVAEPLVMRDRVIFVTLQPSSNTCGYGGTSWLMELSLYSGKRLNESPFDLTEDSKFNVDDLITHNSNKVAVSGIKSKVGIVSTPAIVSSQNTEHKYIPGTSGNIQHIVENPGGAIYGRTQWRQLK